MLVWYPFMLVYGMPLIGPIHPQKCLQQNMGLVHKVAYKYQHQCYESGYMCDYHTHQEELLQIGTITLWNCIVNFNRTRNVQFSTYAYRALHNAMHQYAHPRKRHVECNRFNIVYENTICGKQMKPEEAVDDKLFEETILYLKNKGYKLNKKHYFVQYNLRSFTTDA